MKKIEMMIEICELGIKHINRFKHDELYEALKDMREGAKLYEEKPTGDKK